MINLNESDHNMAFFNKRYHPPGTPPGTLIEAPRDASIPLRIRLIDYNQDEFTSRNDNDAAECSPYILRESLTWVHVQGQPTESALNEPGASFNLHSLALEEVLNSGQCP